MLNLGVEGMMLVGAVAAFIVAGDDRARRGSASLAGMLAGAALSLIFAVLTLSLMANQVASGLALSLFGVGLSAFVGLSYVEHRRRCRSRRWRLPVLSDLPVIGPLLFGHSPLVYLSLRAVRAGAVVPVSHARRPRRCARSASRRSRRTRSATR